MPGLGAGNKKQVPRLQAKVPHLVGGLDLSRRQVIELSQALQALPFVHLVHGATLVGDKKRAAQLGFQAVELRIQAQKRVNVDLAQLRNAPKILFLTDGMDLSFEILQLNRRV